MGVERTSQTVAAASASLKQVVQSTLTDWWTMEERLAWQGRTSRTSKSAKAASSRILDICRWKGETRTESQFCKPGKQRDASREDRAAPEGNVYRAKAPARARDARSVVFHRVATNQHSGRDLKLDGCQLQSVSGSVRQLEPCSNKAPAHTPSSTPVAGAKSGTRCALSQSPRSARLAGFDPWEHLQTAGSKRHLSRR